MVGDKLQPIAIARPANVGASPLQGEKKTPAVETRREQIALMPKAEPPRAGKDEARKEKKKRKKVSRLEVVGSHEDIVELGSTDDDAMVDVPSGVVEEFTATLSVTSSQQLQSSGEVDSQESQERLKRRRSKSERKAGKDAKRRRKEEAGVSSAATSRGGPSESSQKASPAASNEPPDRTVIVPVSAPAMFSGGRHAVRSRYIQQKKLALIDSKALNEVGSKFTLRNDLHS